MNLSDFLGAVAQIKALNPRYQLGHAGDNGYCDCIGLIIGAVERCGVRWDGVHGSNWWARHYTRNMLLISSESELRLGDLVYKGRGEQMAGYDLPDRYADSSDKVDYYHVGVVTGVSPLEITHCTSGGGVDGITVDTKRGKWLYRGQLTLIDEMGKGESMDTAFRTATVYAENGVDVNLRRKPAKNGALIDRIKVGTVVTVATVADGWAKIVTAKGTQGYMMEQYLRFEQAEDATDSPQNPQKGTLADALVVLTERINELEERVAALEGGVG